MLSFEMNGYVWRVLFDSPYSPNLIDRTGKSCLATTDPVYKTVYLSNQLAGPRLRTVLIHELGHCAIVSYGLLDYIHSLLKPSKWIEGEEWICNFLADYGEEIYARSQSILSISEEFERMLA